MCGELRPQAGGPAPLRGSSPRVRGTPSHPRVQRIVRRFIPACAGNSRWASGGACSATVHPRVCGELLRCFHAHFRCRRFIPACAGNSGGKHRRVVRFAGSSPRVRGTRQARRTQRQRHRFTPACAGNSKTLGTLKTRPRRFIPACAGNSPVFRAWLEMAYGSSPRVRGTPRALSSPLAAMAGSSPRVRGTRCRGVQRGGGKPVHPRVCGELVVQRVIGGNRFRFIPACAGNSPLPRTRMGSTRGSSPRVRGTRSRPRCRWRTPRFIPACAGNSPPGDRR